MEIVLVLILLAILYLVPELLRRRGYFEREYEYPEIPEQTPTAKSPVQNTPEFYVDYDNQIYKNNNTVTMPAAVNIQSSAPEKSAWQGKLDNNAVLNGIIFAEILQPPRAYRPLRRR